MVRSSSQKDQLVGEIRGVLDQATHMFLVSLAGLYSNDVNQLRAALRRKGARMRVVKNRLARRAAEGAPAAQLDRWFRGPTAVVYHPSDPVAMAKQLVDFAKDHPQLEVRAGLIGRTEVVAGKDAQAVAELPTLDEARARLLAVLLAPATQLARLLSASTAQLVRVLDARAQKGGEIAAEPAAGGN